MRSAKSLTRPPATQHYIALAYWALVQYFYYLLPDDSSFSCRVVFIRIAFCASSFSAVVRAEAAAAGSAAAGSAGSGASAASASGGAVQKLKKLRRPVNQMHARPLQEL